MGWMSSTSRGQKPPLTRRRRQLTRNNSTAKNKSKNKSMNNDYGSKSNSNNGKSMDNETEPKTKEREQAHEQKKEEKKQEQTISTRTGTTAKTGTWTAKISIINTTSSNTNNNDRKNKTFFFWRGGSYPHTSCIRTSFICGLVSLMTNSFIRRQNAEDGTRLVPGAQGATCSQCEYISSTT